MQLRGVYLCKVFESLFQRPFDFGQNVRRRSQKLRLFLIIWAVVHLIVILLFLLNRLAYCGATGRSVQVFLHFLLGAESGFSLRMVSVFAWCFQA